MKTVLIAPRFTIMLIAALLGIMGTNVLAVDIEETIWGFDGRVVPYQFNPVSLLVSNTTEDPVGIRLQLKRSQRQGGERIGARVHEEVFLSPFSSRWVQFYPYIASESEAWSVSWGFLPSQEKDLQSPRIGAPARVALVDSNQLTNRKGTVKSFSEDLFPPLVSATDTLEVVFLDHVPRWQDQRRQTLLEWVQRGGTVVLTPNASGEHPVFTAQLAIFNSPLPELAVGQGQIIRFKNRKSAVIAITERLGPPSIPALTSNDWGLATGIFQTLKSISNPQHNWWVINFMSLVYVGLVFPGWYLLSRGSAHYRTTILAFIGVAVFFTVAFNIVGRRGYGESTTVNTLAVARKIEGDTYDVQSWTNVFVTGGDQYDLQFEGDGHLYATASFGEKVAAVIDNGLEGKFIADIPLFSSRAFIHRGKATGPQWEVSVRDFPDAETNRPIEKIELDISPPPTGFVYAIYRDRLHAVRAHEDHYRPVKRSQAADLSLVPDNFGNIYDYRYGYAERRVVKPSTIYGRLLNPAIWRSMGGRNQLADDRLRILIYDDLPASFSVKNPQLEDSQGKVLYSIDVRLPGKLKVPDLPMSAMTLEDAGVAETDEPVDDAEDEAETEIILEEPSDDEPPHDE